MLSLILDSATKRMYIALVLDDQVLYEKYYDGANDHAQNIVSGVELALKETGFQVADLNKIVVGVGPGSYTGVRMAVTVGKMLASLKKIPLYSISTLALMASGTKGLVLAGIDARHGNAFAGIFKDGVVEGEEAFVLLDELRTQKHDFEVSQADFIVDPVLTVKVAKLVEEPLLLVPNYLRDTEAERNYDKNNS